jgi:broad specificity phosphatase PhoE
MRLTLLCHASTATTRRGGFPCPGEGLDAPGVRAAAALRPPRTGALRVSPARAPMETAARFGEARVDPALRDMDHGDWTGRLFADLDPAALGAWLQTPAAGAPGGESLDTVVARMAAWLGTVRDHGQDVLAVTHPMVVRAALAAALDLPAAATLRIDIAPLSAATLSFNGLWRLQALTPAGASAD